MGLGAEFAQELSNSMDLIIEFPKMYSELYLGIRRALLKRFPYGVYYIVKDEPKSAGAGVRQARYEI